MEATTIPSFLQRGYLPKELPPCFSTEAFGLYVEKVGYSGLPRNSLDNKKKETKGTQYCFARSGGVRRILSFGNPLTFTLLTHCIEQQWSLIANKLTNSLGASRPELGGPRALKPKIPVDELLEKKVEARTRGQFLLETDISQFYASFYTHCIPWLLAGKEEAKNNRRCKRLAGNEIDKALTSCQSGQTNGIPIGPDTSFLLAELLLANVDAFVTEHDPSVGYYRFFDDFELTYTTRTAAENGLLALQAHLLEFGLELNTQKTKLLELPHVHDKPWRAALRNFSVKIERLSPRSMIDFFDTALSFQRQFPFENVLSYALGRMEHLITEGSDREPLPKKCVDHICSLAFQCALSFPETSQHYVSILTLLQRYGHEWHRDTAAACLGRLIEINCKLKNDNEICWCIWGSIALDLKLPPQTSAAFVSTNSPCVSLLVQVALESSVLDVKPDVSQWISAVNYEGVYGNQWILGFESAGRGWSTKAKNIDGSGFFSELHKHGVSFLKGIEQIRLGSAKDGDDMDELANQKHGWIY